MLPRLGHGVLARDHCLCIEWDGPVFRVDHFHCAIHKHCDGRLHRHICAPAVQFHFSTRFWQVGRSTRDGHPRHCGIIRHGHHLVPDFASTGYRANRPQRCLFANSNRRQLRIENNVMGVKKFWSKPARPMRFLVLGPAGAYMFFLPVEGSIIFDGPRARTAAAVSYAVCL